MAETKGGAEQEGWDKFRDIAEKAVREGGEKLKVELSGFLSGELKRLKGEFEKSVDTLSAKVSGAVAPSVVKEAHRKLTNEEWGEAFFKEEHLKNCEGCRNKLLEEAKKYATETPKPRTAEEEARSRLYG